MRVSHHFNNLPKNKQVCFAGEHVPPGTLAVLCDAAGDVEIVPPSPVLSTVEEERKIHRIRQSTMITGTETLSSSDHSQSQPSHAEV